MLGLSLFELAVVVSIIGVLAAVFLSRVNAARVAARELQLQMLRDTVQTQATLFHLRCEMTASPQRCDRVAMGPVDIEGANGWPAATDHGIVTALKSVEEVTDIEWRPDRLNGVPAMRARLRPAGRAGTCEFIYAQAASPGAAPRIELVDPTCP